MVSWSQGKSAHHASQNSTEKDVAHRHYGVLLWVNEGDEFLEQLVGAEG